MRLAFGASQDDAPEDYARVRLTERTDAPSYEDGWLTVGTGNPADMDREAFSALCERIVHAARENGLTRIAVQFDRTPQLFAAIQDLTPEQISFIAGYAFERASRGRSAPELEDVLACGRTYPLLQKSAYEGQEAARAALLKTDVRA